MPPLISSRGVAGPSDNNTSPNYQDIQNDIILRESAYIADKLLKKLTPAQPVFHHTELVPIRQNRAEAPTAQIVSPKTSHHTGIQKPAPPQMASVGSKLHFNNNLLIPQLKDTGYLGRRRKMVDVEAERGSLTSDRQATESTEYQTMVSRRAQTFPLRNNAPKRDNGADLYVVNEETNTSTNQHDRPPGRLKRAKDHLPTPGPFPLYPSQRLPPPVPAIPTETAAAVYSHLRRSHSQPTTATQDTSSSTENSQQQGRKGHENQRQNNGEHKGASKITGKRRPGQGVTIGMSRSITVPLIGPPPPERRWRNKGQGKGNGKGKMKGGLGLGHDGRSSSRGWEEVEVRGGGA